MLGNEVTGFNSIGKLLTGAVATVVTAGGVLGAVTGGFALLLRNQTSPMIAALSLGVLAATVATGITVWPSDEADRNRSWRIRMWVFAGSAALLVAALGLVLYSQVMLQGTTARPVISAEWTPIGSGMGLRVTAEADSLAKSDGLQIDVIGNNPNGANPYLYSGSTGPDATGKAKQQMTVTVSSLPAGITIDGVVIAARVVLRKNLQPGQQVGSSCNSQDSACLVIKTIPVAVTPTSTR